ncbi:MAG: von Willebrand factor type A domain-containing protein [Planctomycetes bacterium]|nr:von Willebrand factor type A domain-containing protein [Planctomycetota bacterium]
MSEVDPILDAALDELLGGKTPPDLVAQTLAKASATGHAAPKLQPVARPRPLWRAWGGGLAAAALLVFGASLFYSAVVRPQYESASPRQTVASNPVSGAAEAANAAANQAARLDDSRFGVNRTADLPRVQTMTPSIPGPPPPAPPMVPREDPAANPPKPQNGFKAHGSNPFVDTEDDKLSTFALEHDTGSYTVARDFLKRGQKPPEEAIRAEEFINYFHYGYNTPNSAPFSVYMDAAPSRYGTDLKNCVLLRVGVQARVIDVRQRKPAVLTFVVDTSGSMEGDHRLGLVKRALALLVNELQEGDKVGIVAFGTEARTVLEPRDAGSKSQILAAIDSLQAEGSTNAGAGLKVGYEMARANWRDGRTNRVVLCSDGVANTGVSDIEGLVKLIVENRRKGITLSSLGFGLGHMDDHLLETLGDKGDGHYAYIDSIEEAKRMFVDSLTGALEVVGRDVKMQVEFNPRVVKSYRLIGYVNRDVKDEDFRNDAVDGGEIGAGHAATALYELKLYDDANGPVATATVRYKTDEEDQPSEITTELFTKDVAPTWEGASNEFRLAGNVAEFAEILGKSFYAKEGSLEAVLADLQSLRMTDERVTELIELIKSASK